MWYLLYFNTNKTQIILNIGKKKKKKQNKREKNKHFFFENIFL
jgi:hypothetical protein